jgi:hypothetical protein
MAFIVVYDANVLVGNTQRDLLIRIAQTVLVQASGPTGSSMKHSQQCRKADRTSCPRS